MRATGARGEATQVEAGAETVVAKSPNRSRHLDAKKALRNQSFFFIFFYDGPFLRCFVCAYAYTSTKAPLLQSPIGLCRRGAPSLPPFEC
ncbi:MAG: hypothetical protein CME71_08835 [Halobacteriovorax sp.]|nr:hypothetical protein [Halobacteriovorax sp.]